MDLNAVKWFVVSVQAESLTAGARRLNVPLSTLSRRLRALEQQLDVQLMERTHHGIRLTDAGTRLYEYAARGIDALNEAELLTRSEQAGLKGCLRLSIPPGFESWWMLLEAFQQRYPQIQLLVYSTERRVDLLEDGIDVALRVGNIVHEAMVARRLLHYRHRLVAAPALLRRLATINVPGDLFGLPCAAWSTDSRTPAVWTLGSQRVTPEAKILTNDYLQLRNLAIAGEYITELPSFLAWEAVEQGALAPLLPDYPMAEVPLSLLYPSQRHPSSLVRAYVEFCAQHAGDYVKGSRPA